MNTTHSYWILILIITGVLLGGLLGWYFPQTMLSLSWVGDLFLTSLKMLIIPLIIAAIISGVSALGDVRKLGKIGRITITYYLVTTSIAVIIGLIMVNLIQPGLELDFVAKELPPNILNKQNIGINEILHSLVTPNLVDSMAQTQILPLIVFSIFFSASLTTLGDLGKPVLNFFNGMNLAMMRLVIWLMYLAPIGIFSLVAARIATAGGGESFQKELSAVALYISTVLIGLGIHFIILIFILFFIAKRGIGYLWGMLQALLVAFGTASSSATLPLTMKCASDAGINNKSVRFVLPLGSTINMDGTALYEAVAVMFIAQAYGIHMNMGTQIIIFITASLAAIGAAGIPEAGLVTMVIVLQAVGLPLEGIGILLAVDWFLDRFRTTINVWGDCVGAAVLDRYLKHDEATQNQE